MIIEWYYSLILVSCVQIQHSHPSRSYEERNIWKKSYCTLLYMLDTSISQSLMIKNIIFCHKYLFFNIIFFLVNFLKSIINMNHINVCVCVCVCVGGYVCVCVIEKEINMCTFICQYDFLFMMIHCS